MTGTVVPINETQEPTYLGRLLDVIELVSSEHAPSSYRNAAARVLGVPPSTAHRLLTLLLNRGYCDRNEEGVFLPGPRLVSIGAQALDRLTSWGAAQQAVVEICEQTGESASFGLLIGDQIVLVARQNSPHVLTAIATVGDVLSPHTSALGKVILANAPEEQRRKIVGRFVADEVDRVLDELVPELVETERTGYSIDEETFSPGMRCRAIPVIDAKSSMLGGLSVSGPVARFTTEKAESAVPLLQDTAKRLLTRSL